MVKITIITICKNNESTIGRAIESVLIQKSINLEYIIIDGGSVDKTLEIIKKHQNDKTVVISENDNGIADAFNKGLKRATGDIVGFLNSDDWYKGDKVLKLISDNYSDDNTILCGSIELYSEYSRMIKRLDSKPDKLRDGMYVRHPATFVPIGLIKKVGYFDTKYKISMDFEYFTRLRLVKAEFKRINTVITCMQVGGVSANFIASIKEELFVKNKYYGHSIKNYYHYYFSYLISVIRS